MTPRRISKLFFDWALRFSFQIELNKQGQRQFEKQLNTLAV